MEMADELQSDARRCLMSFRLLNFPPQASTRTMRVPMRWIGLDSGLAGSGFLGSWLDDDNDPDRPNRRINWGAFGGLALSLMISGGFLTGVGILVERTLR
jgi:hypothetical protein